MIDQKTVDTLLEELDQYKKEIGLLTHLLFIVKFVEDIPDAYREEITKMLYHFLDNRKADCRIIQDILVLEYEHLEIEPILESLNA